MTYFLRGDAARIPLATNSVDLVIGSPSYGRQRLYLENGQDLGIARVHTNAWVQWMLDVTIDACRVSRGAVLWVASGAGNYEPAVEGLIWEARKVGLCLLRPCIWTKNAPPTGKGWFSNDWEFVAGFAKKLPLDVFNGEALEQPLKYTKGGAFRQRGKDGQRKAGGAYPTHHFRKRPSNVLHVTVGGGHLGEDRTDEEFVSRNEAPFPMALVEPFIKVLTDPGGIVFDPFSGSGTTAKTAAGLGRVGVGMDLRHSQVMTGMERCKYLSERHK